MGRGQITNQAREQLRATVRSQIERVVAVYSNYPWNASTVDNWLANARTSDAEMNQIVVIRLADTVEDVLDRAMLFSTKQENLHRQISLTMWSKLTEVLGYPGLGNSLRCVLQENDGEVDLTPLREVYVGVVRRLSRLSRIMARKTTSAFRQIRATSP